MRPAAPGQGECAPRPPVILPPPGREWDQGEGLHSGTFHGGCPETGILPIPVCRKGFHTFFQKKRAAEATLFEFHFYLLNHYQLIVPAVVIVPQGASIVVHKDGVLHDH